MKLSRSVVAVLILLAGGVAQSKAGTLHGSDVNTDDLLTINTSTGLGTSVGTFGSLGFGNVSGLAFDPIPEPSTLTLAACALLGFAGFGWRATRYP